jgi:hypothetical protein
MFLGSRHGGARYSPPVQAGPGVHSASYTIGTGRKAAGVSICKFILNGIRILKMSFVSIFETGDIKSHKRLA